MLSEFAQQLICGMSLIWCLLPRSQVTAGFFRIQMFVVLGLGVLVATGLTDAGGSGVEAISRTVRLWTGVLTAVLAFIGSVAWRLERRRAGDVLIYLIAAVSTAGLMTAAVYGSGYAAGDALYTGLSELSAALLLGSVTTGMLLGHWYLTAPGMSLAPLIRANLYLGIAGLFRLGISAAAVWLVWSELTGLTHWVWLSLRWAAGIVAPLAVCLLVWRILKYRNTQSATGVLYVGTVLTFVGELAAALLSRELAAMM